MVFHIFTPMTSHTFQITATAYQLWELTPVPRFQFRPHGLETANFAVKVSDGQLYLVDHKIISVTSGLARFRGGTRSPFAFNRLRLASVRNVSQTAMHFHSRGLTLNILFIFPFIKLNILQCHTFVH